MHIIDLFIFTIVIFQCKKLHYLRCLRCYFKKPLFDPNFSCGNVDAGLYCGTAVSAVTSLQ